MGCGRAGTVTLEWGIDPSASRPGGCGCGGEPCPCGCTGGAADLHERGVWSGQSQSNGHEPLACTDRSDQPALDSSDSVLAMNTGDHVTLTEIDHPPAQLGPFAGTSSIRRMVRDHPFPAAYWEEGDGTCRARPALPDLSRVRAGVRCDIRKDIPWGPCGDIAGPCRDQVPDPLVPDLACYEYYRHSTGAPCDFFYRCEARIVVPSTEQPVELSPLALDAINPCREGSTADVKACAEQGGVSENQMRRDVRAGGGTLVSQAPANRCGALSGVHWNIRDAATREFIGSVICCECCLPDHTRAPANQHCRINWR